MAGINTVALRRAGVTFFLSTPLNGAITSPLPAKHIQPKAVINKCGWLDRAGHDGGEGLFRVLARGVNHLFDRKRGKKEQAEGLNLLSMSLRGAELVSCAYDGVLN